MDLRNYSPITWAIERVFHLLTYLPPQWLMHRALGLRSGLAESQVESAEFTASRARKVELFLVTYYVLDIAAFGSTFSHSTLALVLAAVWAILRIVDILQATVNVALFDQMRGRADNRVASKVRLTTLTVVNFFELILCFSTIYATGFIEKLNGASTPWDALYFSVMTQLTISFGDVTPQSGLRAVAAVQALSGLSFIVLIFARTISALPHINEVIDGGPKHDA